MNNPVPYTSASVVDGSQMVFYGTSSPSQQIVNNQSAPWYQSHGVPMPVGYPVQVGCVMLYGHSNQQIVSNQHAPWYQRRGVPMPLACAALVSCVLLPRHSSSGLL